MTAHATPVSGFEEHYDQMPPPDDCIIDVRTTGRVTHVTVTPYFSGRPGTPMVLQLPTLVFDALVNR